MFAEVEVIIRRQINVSIYATQFFLVILMLLQSKVIAYPIDHIFRCQSFQVCSPSMR